MKAPVSTRMILMKARQRVAETKGSAQDTKMNAEIADSRARLKILQVKHKVREAAQRGPARGSGRLGESACLGATEWRR